MTRWVKHIGPRICRLVGDDQGHTASEYAIMLALIAGVSMATIQSIGEKFAALYTIIANAMPEGFG